MAMRMKCTISYDGTGFAGYQVQPNKRTVQGDIEAALARIHKGESVKINASGRTDAGVHAKGQVIHFDTSLKLPEDKWIVALNSHLPDDIVMHQVKRTADDFHARFDALRKEYRYFIRLSKLRDPFSRQYAYHYKYPINVKMMEKAAETLIGTYDFTSFCSAKTEVEDRVRTINVIDIVEDEDVLMFRFVGNGFLYNMVRILVGTLLEVGRGLKMPEQMVEILAAMDRNQAGKTAPPQGLYLWKVHYEE